VIHHDPRHARAVPCHPYRSAHRTDRGTLPRTRVVDWPTFHSHASSRRAQGRDPRSVPGCWERRGSAIEALVTNPSTASELPMHQIPALVAKLAFEQATLSALQGVLTARLLASRENAATSAEWTDRLLTAEQVATILGVTKRVGATPGATTALCSTPVSACRALFGI